MHKTELYAVDSSCVISRPEWSKAYNKYGLVPISGSCHLFVEGADVVLKFRLPGGKILDSVGKFKSLKEQKFLSIPSELKGDFHGAFSKSQNFLIVVEGVKNATTAIFHFVDEGSEFWSDISHSSPQISLTGHDLPPQSITNISSEFIASRVYKHLSKSDPELYSISTQRFLNSSHILGHLFAHSTYLSDSDSIVFLEKLRIISDRLRSLLGDRIKCCERNHHETWARFQGEKISFCDGGVSRIVSIPGVAPTGIRVGVYTAIPGETDPEAREQWALKSSIMGSVLNDNSIVEDDEPYDEKRFQEAARYILESLVALNFAEEESPRILFLHGPLQNSFETYTELDPYYIPGVCPTLLSSYGFTKEEITRLCDPIPRNAQGTEIWNSPLPVYLSIQKRITRAKTSMVGIVERSASDAVSKAVLKSLVDNKKITKTLQKRLLKEIRQFDIKDELLFGCILRPGEYLEPLSTMKNIQRRARDRWQGAVAKFPPVFSTMLKVSDHSFPFRIEFGREYDASKIYEIIQLTYHTSLLLPKYAFPVGIDIVDKYAKIPDWLSQGVSAQLAATIYKRCIQTGDNRLLEQMRNVLARSPRDFFFRPTAK